MKFIDRSTVPAPSSLDLTDPNSNASKELRAVKEHLRTKQNKAFKFKAYKKGDDVADSLDSLFKGLCAYCESNFAATSPGDVEHYRPKSKVKENDTHPGYWWVAADWQNLLMSCTDCNRGRYQYHYDTASGQCVLSEKTSKLGKECSFPILSPNYATNEDEDLEQENPLLIDPTRRDPSDHLEWNIINELPLLAPRKRNDKPDPYGDATITILGLNRKGLVENRLSILKLVQLNLSFIERDFIEVAESEDANEIEKRLGKAVSQFSELYQFAKDNQSYASLLRDYLDKEKKRLTKNYSDLLSKLQSTASSTPINK
jgi:uncharacterized protein (TIGR02646 family)